MWKSRLVMRTMCMYYVCECSLVPRPIPSFSMLHSENWEGLVCDIMCVTFRDKG